MVYWIVLASFWILAGVLFEVLAYFLKYAVAYFSNVILWEPNLLQSFASMSHEAASSLSLTGKGRKASTVRVGILVLHLSDDRGTEVECDEFIRIYNIV